MYLIFAKIFFVKIPPCYLMIALLGGIAHITRTVSVSKNKKRKRQKKKERKEIEFQNNGHPKTESSQCA